jgi:hypothetical protein
MAIYAILHAVQELLLHTAALSIPISTKIDLIRSPIKRPSTFVLYSSRRGDGYEE